METRYSELAQRIIMDISSGAIPVGTRLPSEVAMAQQYGVSRSTIRSALDLVADVGLISRKRRIGTVVERAHVAGQYTKSVQSLEDLIQYAAVTNRTVLASDDVVCDDALAQALECRPGQRWLRVSMLRTEQDSLSTPVCWTDAYIRPQEGEAILPHISGGTGLLCDLIEHYAGRALMTLKQQIGARILPPDIATRLDVAPGTAGLEISRHYIDRSQSTFMITVSVYPAEKFRYTFMLQRKAPQA